MEAPCAGVGASRAGTQKGVSLSAELLPLLSPSTCTLVMGVASPSSSPAGPKGQLSLGFAAPPAGGALRRSPAGVATGRARSKAARCRRPHFLVEAARVAAGSQGRCSPLPPLLWGAHEAAQSQAGGSAYAPPLAITWGRALQVPMRRPRRVFGRAPGAWDAER